MAGAGVQGWASKASDATTDIQPGAGVEWLIHTLMSGRDKTMEVYLTADGSTFTLVESLTGGSVHSYQWRLTNTIWMRLKNTSGGTAYNGYMGMVPV